MIVQRREDGKYTSGIVYTCILGRPVPVASEPFIGDTFADVINQAYGNAMVRHWRSSLLQQWSMSKAGSGSRFSDIG